MVHGDMVVQFLSIFQYSVVAINWIFFISPRLIIIPTFINSLIVFNLMHCVLNVFFPTTVHQWECQGGDHNKELCLHNSASLKAGQIQSFRSTVLYLTRIRTKLSLSKQSISGFILWLEAGQLFLYINLKANRNCTYNIHKITGDGMVQLVTDFLPLKLQIWNLISIF